MWPIRPPVSSEWRHGKAETQAHTQDHTPVAGPGTIENCSSQNSKVPEFSTVIRSAIREFTDWYCSEPRLAFNKTVVTRYRIFLEQAHYAASTINRRLAAVRRLAYEASDATTMANRGF